MLLQLHQLHPNGRNALLRLIEFNSIYRSFSVVHVQRYAKDCSIQFRPMTILHRIRMIDIVRSFGVRKASCR